MENKETRDFIDLEVVCAYLGVSMSTVYRYIHSKENPLPSFKISRGVIKVDKKELDAWIENFRNKNLERKN
jgi:excisionase family DNA binding protein